jgi:hypothetical protein
MYGECPEVGKEHTHIRLYNTYKHDIVQNIPKEHRSQDPDVYRKK